MRKIIELADNWTFIKDETALSSVLSKTGESVSIPHTYNAIDGQDGGNDYFRGTCWYKCQLDLSVSKDEVTYLEIDGAAMSADVYLNGIHLKHHDGGYSRFRVDLTDTLSDTNTLCISVNNQENETVYPQTADFTFYGGLYRMVKLISVPKSHFDLDYYGSNGVKVTPVVEGNHAHVRVEAWIKGDAKTVSFTTNEETKQADVIDGYATCQFLIEDVRLWHGLEDPYLYDLRAVLESGDEVSVKYGCRYFEIDPEKGFILNGKEYPLRGVSRHQDRKGVGSALTYDMHQEDMALIEEIGATTVRLAHYQHAQEFYDLCDEKGLVVWAEIPYITKHMPNAFENSMSQMQELVVQNYHHPSIVVWGLSNEITAASVVDENLLENHQQLHDLCHRLDETRLTTLANVFMLETDSPIIDVPDVNSYNLYFGWYLGELAQNDAFFDAFHKQYPQKAIGFSEYGADANPQYQTSNPGPGDYTETYQAVYHEHMIKMINARPWLWATHLWNLFDFAADGRDEGGKNGENQKGLITIDRKIKKDAFYLYKAYWNKKDPFVHLAGKRYIDRAEDKTQIKVYSNIEKVSLFMDGTHVATKEGEGVFDFEIEISKEHHLEVIAGTQKDSMIIKRVDTPNESYIFNNQNKIINWFDQEDFKKDHYSIHDTLGELAQNEKANILVQQLMSKASASRGDVAEQVKDNPSLQRMMQSMPLSSMLKQAGDVIKEEQIEALNRLLQQIKK